MSFFGFKLPTFGFGKTTVADAQAAKDKLKEKCDADLAEADKAIADAQAAEAAAGPPVNGTAAMGGRRRKHKKTRRGRKGSRRGRTGRKSNRL